MAPVAEQEGDEHEALRAQNAAALQATDKGDFEAARRLFAEVGARAAEAGDRMIVAFVAVNLAGLFIQEGDYAAGIEYGAKAVELFRELGDENGQCSSHRQLGVVLARPRGSRASRE
jgi:hypothetical protein